MRAYPAWLDPPVRGGIGKPAADDLCLVSGDLGRNKLSHCSIVSRLNVCKEHRTALMTPHTSADNRAYRVNGIAT